MGFKEIKWILILVVVIGIFIYNRFYSKKSIVKRNLIKADYKKINKVKSGEFVKIIGEVEYITEPLIAPISGRKCAYYYVHVQKQVSNKNRSWKTVVEEDVSQKFIIRGGLDCAIINSEYVKSYIVEDRNYESDIFKDPKPNMIAYLRRQKVLMQGIFGFNKTFRYKEGIIEEGEKIAVVGKGEWLDADLVGIPEKYGRVLAISEEAEDYVYLSDDISIAGKMDGQEK